jgi:hypothetical protein
MNNRAMLPPGMLPLATAGASILHIPESEREALGKQCKEWRSLPTADRSIET